MIRERLRTLYVALLLLYWQIEIYHGASREDVPEWVYVALTGQTTVDYWQQQGGSR